MCVMLTAKVITLSVAAKNKTLKMPISTTLV